MQELQKIDTCYIRDSKPYQQMMSMLWHKLAHGKEPCPLCNNHPTISRNNSDDEEDYFPNIIPKVN